MPNPTISDLHVNTPLTDLSVAYTQDENNFVASKMFPIIPVQKQGDKFYVWDIDDYRRTDAGPRAPGTRAPQSGPRLSDDSYFCDRVSLGYPISDPERANADPAVSNLDADATEYLTQQIAIKDEQDFVTAAFATGLWFGASSTEDMTGASTAPATTTTHFLQWNDVASIPIEDIHGEQMSVLKRTGRKPNTLLLGAEVWNALQDHPDILDRIKYTERGIVTEALVASLLGVDRVLIANASNNTAAEESTSAPTNAFILGKSALLAYVTPSPGLRTPTAGYQFVWVGETGTPPSGMGGRIKRYRDEPIESDVIEIDKWRDFKIVGSSLGAFFTGAVA